MVGKVTTIQRASASRIPAIMGHNPYSTPNDELDLSIRARKEGVHHYESQTFEAADWGNDLEDLILTRAAERLGLQNLKLVWPVPFDYKGILQASLDGGASAENLKLETDPDRKIFVFTDDGKITLDGKGVLEAKLTRVSPSDTPALYRGPLQLQAQMLCTGAQWGVIATLYQGVELYMYVYKSNPEIQDQIIKACADFERRIESEEYYPALSAAEAVKMHPDIEQVEIEADETLSEKISQLAHIRSELKAYKALEEDLQVDIMNMMGDATTAYAGSFKAVWPIRHIKAKPARIKEIAAVEESWERGQTLKVDGI